jgi:hypothetical protein
LAQVVLFFKARCDLSMFRNDPPKPTMIAPPTPPDQIADRTLLLGAASSSRVRQTAADSLAARLPALPEIPSDEPIRQHEGGQDANNPILIGSTTLALPPVSKHPEPIVEMPTVWRDEDAERLQELTGKHYLNEVMQQENHDEFVRKAQWSCVVCVWCTYKLTCLIIIIVVWSAVRRDDVYWLDELPAMCEDLYTTRVQGRCSVQVRIQECFKEEATPESVDCARTLPNEIVYEERDITACEWYTNLFGRYQCWYHRDKDGQIRIDTMGREQAQRTSTANLVWGCLLTLSLLIMCCASAWYSRRSYIEWKDFECEPWNRWEV